MSLHNNLIELITLPFDIEENANRLRNLMKDGKYEDLIIYYLSTISNISRQTIAGEFYKDYGKNLTKELQSLLSNDVRDLMSAIMLPPEQYHCKILNRYLKKPGTNKELLLEILCTISKSTVAYIAYIYKIMYNCPLVEELSTNKKNNFRRLLAHIIAGARFAETRLDADRALEYVQVLSHEGPAMWGKDEGTFVKILANETFAMIRFIFILYRNLGTRSIEDVITEELHGELKDAMFDIVRCIMNPPAWLAGKLHRVLKENDSDHDALVRILVGRAENDLEAISGAYECLFGTTLLHDLKEFSEEKETCLCLGNSSIRRFVSRFYKPRNASARKVAKKVLLFTTKLEHSH